MIHRLCFVYVRWVTFTLLLVLQASVARAGNCVDCGSNAATVNDGVVFDEVSLDADARGTGPRIMSAKTETDLKVQLQVEKDELVAYKSGKRVEYQVLSVTVQSDSTAVVGEVNEYVLTIKRFDGLKFWAPPHVAVHAYTVWAKKTRPILGQDQYLCKGGFGEPTVSKVAEQGHAAFVFTGDRYAPNHEVSAGPKSLFNLACFGTAAAKMHLLRHTEAGAPSDRAFTTLAQRTAMLRAITADYCGDGKSWTADGTPLWWTDRRNLFSLDTQPGYSARARALFPRRVEAVWGLNGALLCLNEPRRTPKVSAETTDSCSSVPAVERSDVTKGAFACKSEIPRCGNFAWRDIYGRDPWIALPLLLPGMATTGGASNAYIITVTPSDHPNYCNRGSRIHWPPAHP